MALEKISDKQKEILEFIKSEILNSTFFLFLNEMLLCLL